MVSGLKWSPARTLGYYVIMLLWVTPSCRSEELGTLGRLTERALNMTLGHFLERFGEGSTLPDQDGTYDSYVGEVGYHISGMKITRASRPHTKLTVFPDGRLTMEIHNCSVTVHGHWKYAYTSAMSGVTTEGSGVFDLEISEAYYDLEVNSSFSIFLGPTISGVVCTCKLTNVQIPYDEEEGWLEGYVRGSIEDSVQTEASEALCSILNRNHVILAMKGVYFLLVASLLLILWRILLRR